MTALAVATTPIEKSVEAPGPLAPLKGTMLSANPASSPIIVIVPGSGPTDRNGDSPSGMKAASYRLLAEQLALLGVSSVRIDKRGMFASKPAVIDANAVTISDYASDIHSWITATRSITQAPCVWVLGHSEGGLVALAAAQDPTGICGLVLIASPGRPLGDIVKEQLNADPATARWISQANAAIEGLQAGRSVDVSSLPPPLASLFRPAVQGFWRDELGYDPAALIATLRKPILILQGERDLQVRVVDAQRLDAAQPAAKLVLLPNVNHALKTVTSDDRDANLATYFNPNLPLAPGVAAAVADFVKANSANSR